MMAEAPHVPQFIDDLGGGKFLGGVPNDLFLWAPLAIADDLRLAFTGYGRLLYAVGDNREACQLAGIRVWRVLLVNYVMCGLLAATAGLVIVGGVDTADIEPGRCLSLAVGGGGDNRRHLDLRRSRRLFRHHRRRVDPDGA